MRYRVRVEVEYFIALTYALPELAGIAKTSEDPLRNLYRQFSEADAQAIKEIEKTTNHDVKAVEYFLKEKLEAMGLGKHKEFIHFGLTSQDINNTAIPLALMEFLENEYLPSLQKLVSELTTLSMQWKDVPMLARTHGQPASPTRMGKELYVFIERINRQLVVRAAANGLHQYGGQRVHGRCQNKLAFGKCWRS